MNAKLTFNKVSFNAVNNPSDTTQIWITSADLAKALGYARQDSVNKIYERNKDEFIGSMSQNVKLTFSGEINGLRHQTTKVFSLRGCHLVAMFAKTSVAKEFRRWVLDIIEKSGEQSNIESRLSTPTDRVPLKDAVNVLVARRKINYPTAYGMVNSHFGVESSKELTIDQLASAVKYAYDLALDGEVMDDDFQHPLFNEPNTKPLELDMRPFPASILEDDFGERALTYKGLVDLYGERYRGQVPIASLLRQLESHGYDTSGCWMEYSGLRHLLRSTHQRLERVQDFLYMPVSAKLASN